MVRPIRKIAAASISVSSSWPEFVVVRFVTHTPHTGRDSPIPGNPGSCLSAVFAVGLAPGGTVQARRPTRRNAELSW